MLGAAWARFRREWCGAAEAEARPFGGVHSEEQTRVAVRKPAHDLARQVLGFHGRAASRLRAGLTALGGLLVAGLLEWVMPPEAARAWSAAPPAASDGERGGVVVRRGDGTLKASALPQRTARAVRAFLGRPCAVGRVPVLSEDAELTPAGVAADGVGGPALRVCRIPSAPRAARRAHLHRQARRAAGGDGGFGGRHGRPPGTVRPCLRTCLRLTVVGAWSRARCEIQPWGTPRMERVERRRSPEWAGHNHPTCVA